MNLTCIHVIPCISSAFVYVMQTIQSCYDNDYLKMSFLNFFLSVPVFLSKLSVFKLRVHVHVRWKPTDYDKYRTVYLFTHIHMSLLLLPRHCIHVHVHYFCSMSYFVSRVIEINFTVGCDPKVMGIGPAPASRAALKSAGKSLEDMDIVEVFW